MKCAHRNAYIHNVVVTHALFYPELECFLLYVTKPVNCQVLVVLQLLNTKKQSDKTNRHITNHSLRNFHGHCLRKEVEIFGKNATRHVARNYIQILTIQL
jgi:hypothetical protein